MNPTNDKTGIQNKADLIHRIRLTARLAATMARSCSFSRDPHWFWNLAKAEIDQCYGERI